MDAAAADDALVAAVAALAARSRRVVGVCSGAFLLAAAGLLDGRRATTHWARARRLARQHPAVDVDADPIWIRDGDVWTSAGVTAGIDVALALVEDDVGIEVAETRRPLARDVPAPARRAEPVRRAGVARPGPAGAGAAGPGADRRRARAPTTASACWRRRWR